MHGLDMSNMSCPVEMWHDEPSGIWAYFTFCRMLIKKKQFRKRLFIGCLGLGSGLTLSIRPSAISAHCWMPPKLPTVSCWWCPRQRATSTITRTAVSRVCCRRDCLRVLFAFRFWIEHKINALSVHLCVLAEEWLWPLDLWWLIQFPVASHLIPTPGKSFICVQQSCVTWYHPWLGCSGHFAKLEKWKSRRP